MSEAIDLESQLTRRAVALALWPALKARAWRPHRVIASSSHNPANPYALKPAMSTVARHQHGRQAEAVIDQPYIRACLWREEWPGGLNFVIEITRARYELALLALDMRRGGDHADILDDAYAIARTQHPFHLATNRHGTRKYRRNTLDPSITPVVAYALETIARACTIEVVDDHTVDDALLGEDVAPGLVKLGHALSLALDERD